MSRPIRDKFMTKALQGFVLLLALSPLHTGADFSSAAEAYRTRNYPEAFEAFESLAKAGDPRAQTVIALMYKYGEGVALDLDKSFFWYRQAAEAGYPPAQFHLGMMYLEGIGTTRNEQSAFDWLRRSAEAGFERASVELDQLDAEGAAHSKRGDTPSSWSQAWNFRLPNAVRYAAAGEDEERYRVQLGTVASRESANHLWESLQIESGDLFTGLNPRISRSVRDDRILYDVQAGPFADMDRAQAFCRELDRQGSKVECLPVAVN